MKNFYRTLFAFIAITALTLADADLTAGNKDRTGQAGAPELLINPWARSSGWASATTSRVEGLESFFSNIAGLAFAKNTELIFSRTQWLKGTDIDINNFGIAQRLSESSVLGVAVTSMSFGDLKVTTTDQPEGTGATFSPNLLNVKVAFSKAFSNSIYGGVALKIISHSIPDASAQGIAIDVGVNYVTGPQDNLRFGVALRNWGPKMMFTGDGFSIKAAFQNSDYSVSVNQRAESFEIPAQLRIGMSYDFIFPELGRLTLAGNFVSNSFTKDQFALGAEFSFRDYLMIRGGYTYENNITDDISAPAGVSYNAERTNVYNGPSAGLTVQVPFSKETNSGLSIDYSYQTTAHFSGTHVFGVRLNF